MTDPPDWGSWDEDRRRKLALGASSTPDERVAWLEEMAQLAWDAGALPKPRDPWGRFEPPPTSE